MIYFDNIHPEFPRRPVDPQLVCGIHVRDNGTTVIHQVGKEDVITSVNFFDCCYAIGAATLAATLDEKEKKSSTRGKRILDFTRDKTSKKPYAIIPKK